MPVQEQVIPTLLTADHDLVALAQTGTGKTAAFGLPTIQRTDTHHNTPQALILAPTRELCLQIAGDLADYSKYIPDLRILPVYGGSSIESQIRALRQGVQIIVATPGRLIDLINRGEVHLDHVHTVILDEADEMLNMGFVDSINDILAHIPQQHKTLMFSATMPAEAARIAARYMNNPREITIGTKNQSTDNVRHIYYMVNARDKYLALKRICDDNPNIYAIVFCPTRRDTAEVADHLIADGYNADALHGDLSQQQRDIVMRKFRDHVTTLLVATDVAARGLDVDNLTHVINYGLPADTAVYTHRSGRTGRAGKTGTSVAIIHSREKSRLREIERIIGHKFQHRDVPTPQHIIEKQLYNLADRIERTQVNQQEIDPYIPGVLKKLSWLTTEDLIKRILTLEFQRLLNYYKDAPNIDYIDTPRTKEPRKPADKDRRTAPAGMQRIYVDAGKADGFYAGNLIDLLNHDNPGPRINVGRIDLMPHYTLFDINKADTQRTIQHLRASDFLGRHLHVEVADPNRNYTQLTTPKPKHKSKKK